MKKGFLNDLQYFLEKIDRLRDKVLFIFIKKYWPKAILPNHITAVRIFISILLLVLLFYFGIENKVLIITLFCIGAFSDMLDGSVARCFKEETEFGATLDSTADRLLIVPIAIYSLIDNHRFLLLFLVSWEVVNAIISAYLQSKKIFIESNIFGKTKMVLQSIVFAAILFFWPKSPDPFFIYILWLSSIFIVLSIFFKLVDAQKRIQPSK